MIWSMLLWKICKNSRETKIGANAFLTALDTAQTYSKDRKDIQCRTYKKPQIIQKILPEWMKQKQKRQMSFLLQTSLTHGVPVSGAQWKRLAPVLSASISFLSTLAPGQPDSTVPGTEQRGASHEPLNCHTCEYECFLSSNEPHPFST